MKRFIYTVCLLLTTTTGILLAQEEMNAVWESKLEHKIENTGIADTKGLLLASNDKEISIARTKDGSIAWTKRFKDIAPGLSKIDEQIPMWESNVIFLFDRKMGKDKVACVDAETGNFLWMTDKYQDVTEDNVVYIPEMEAFAVSTKTALTMIKARTGEEIWTTSKFKGVVGAYTVSNDNHIVMLNFKPDLLSSLFSGFKNQIVKINMQNGDVLWDQTYIGLAEKKVVTREPTARLRLVAGKVFLHLNGIQVYDYATGAQQWSAAFDADLNVVGKPAGAKRFGCYGVVADPLILDNDVYVIDMKDKKKQFIKKYDLNSGKLLWTSPEIESAKALPGLYFVDGTLLLQIGGVIECQAYIETKQRNPDGSYTITQRWTVYYRNVKPNGVQAFNSTNGEKLWESERFKKGITNGFPSNGNFIVSSGKALYSLDIKTGAEKAEVALSNDDIGLVQKIIDYSDRVIVVGDKGISGHSKTDGKLINSGRWKSGDFAGLYGKTLLFQRDNDDFAAYDVETCKYLYYDARKNSISKLSADGKFVYVWEKNSVSKLGTTK